MQIPCKKSSSFCFLTFGDGRFALFGKSVLYWSNCIATLKCLKIIVFYSSNVCHNINNCEQKDFLFKEKIFEWHPPDDKKMMSWMSTHFPSDSILLLTLMLLFQFFVLQPVCRSHSVSVSFCDLQRPQWHDTLPKRKCHIYY